MPRPSAKVLPAEASSAEVRVRRCSGSGEEEVVGAGAVFEGGGVGEEGVGEGGGGGKSGGGAEDVAVAADGVVEIGGPGEFAALDEAKFEASL